MRLPDIAMARLTNQHIAGTKYTKAAELVQSMGAVQAQDYAMSKWGIGLRLRDAEESDIEKAIDKGTLIRTHVLRPTWHIVAATDIYWMLALSAAKIKAQMQTMNRQLELSEKLFTKSNGIIEKELGKGKHLPREALSLALEKEKIATRDTRLAHLLVRAELDGIICSGKTQGHKKTYAMLAERVPQKNLLNKEESLALLAKKYFASRGPATVEDFSWWSGLTLTDARRGLESIKKDLLCEKIAGSECWFGHKMQTPVKPAASVYLLPAFDEFIISYKDRSASLPAEHGKKALTGNGIFYPVIIVNGKVTGLWKRSVQKNTLHIETSFFEKPGRTTERLLKNEIKRLQQFLSLPYNLHQPKS